MVVPDAVLLKYAKTKLIMKNTANVKNAKKFSDLTSTKQKIARSAYEKEIAKKSKNITRAPPSAKKKYGHTDTTFLLGAPPSKKRIETGKGNPGKVVKTTKKGNARKGKPVGSRLAFDATKQEADKKKETRKKPVGFIAGPKLPPRNDGGSGGTGRVISKKKKDMMDMISEYMKETGKIPKGPTDPSFVKWMKKQ